VKVSLQRYPSVKFWQKREFSKIFLQKKAKHFSALKKQVGISGVIASGAVCQVKSDDFNPAEKR